MLVPRCDAGAWAVTVVSIIGDPERRTAMSRAGRDGPRPSATEPILDTLAQEGVPAAFFLVGAAVRRIVAAGHEIGKSHPPPPEALHRLGPRAIGAELGGAHQDLFEVSGVAPRAFRAPHGYRNPFVARVARGLGYRMVAWAFGVWDSDRPGAHEIRRRVRGQLRPGAIVLLHDDDGDDPEGSHPRGARSGTAAALPGIIADARAAGCELRPLGELLA